MPFIYSYTFENKKLQKKASPNIPLHHTSSSKLTLYSLLCQKSFFKTAFYFQPFHACSIHSCMLGLFFFRNWWKLRSYHHCSAFPQSSPNFFLSYHICHPSGKLKSWSLVFIFLWRMTITTWIPKQIFYNF